MRKLTGYIGAMIIVFALAGSILTGYALNINGHTAVINEYEQVTDVSGLYSHSDEKSYIEYAPASNYTGYATATATYNNPTGAGTNTYKKIDNGSIGIDTNAQVYIGGVLQGSVTSSPRMAVFSDKFYCLFDGSNNTVTLCDSARTLLTSGITSITKSGTNVTITTGGNTYTYSNVNLMLAYCTKTPDYYIWSTYVDNNPRDIYLNNELQSIILVRYTKLGILYNDSWFSTYVSLGQTDTIPSFNNGTVTDYGVNKYTSSGILPSPYLIDCIAYPMAVNSYTDMGVNYTESSRVNNYPVLNSPENTTTRTDRIDLMNISAGDMWPTDNMFNKTWYIVNKTTGSLPHYFYTAPYYSTTNQNSVDRTKLHDYRLSDILNTYTIPIGAQYLKITSDSTDIRNYTATNVNINIDCNVVGFCNIPEQTVLTLTNDCLAGQKDYVIYDLTTQVCTVYDYSGVVKYSNSANNIGVLFCDNTLNYGWMSDVYSGGSTSVSYSMANRARPFIDITSTIYNPADIDYIDITKGYWVKNTNTTNVIWNNDYENGDIKILFRAADTGNTYSNTITVSNNTIQVNYTDSKFSVKLNSADSVNVGMWRNIVLDIDLQNGKLSVIPVRTFNSYTNVVMDRTTITIGDLFGAAPTNTVLWSPTNNSLMFNVYSTDVFMNTYNVVMVNPTLDITDYFTDLNQFYRLNLYNFATYGNSITINGETMNVTNGTITYDNNTIELRDMYITYADGNVSIGDSHTNIELGEITTTNISMAGAWYFLTELERGYTSQKVVYEWDWGDFIFNNTQFCVFYIGFALAGLIIARKFCNLSIIDYAVYITSIVIALSVQVI